MRIETTTTALAASMCLLLAAAPAQVGNYVQAPGSTLAFTSQYDGEAFSGRFGSFNSRLQFDPGQLATARLDVTIALAGARTGNHDRDSTLQSAAFFNVARFAQARYTATRFHALGGNRYAADGSLSLRGVSKPVTLTFTWSAGARPVLVGKATVKRLDFGIGTGDWADTTTLPNDVAISTRVVFAPVK